MAKTKCDICGEPAGFMKMEYADGVVCSKCFRRANSHAFRIFRSSSEVQAVLQDTERFDKMPPEEKEKFLSEAWEATKDKRMAAIVSEAKRKNVQVKPVDNTPKCPKCPKCGSTSISADKKGYGIGKGVVGAAVAGPLGLVLGNAGAKKVRITCLACGYHWMAGQK